MAGEVLSVNLSSLVGTKKRPVSCATLRAGYGLEGDAHAGSAKRQVSLLDESSIAKMNAGVRAAALTIKPGDFAENLTTRGLDFASVRIGTVLRVGREAVLEISQIGKECHLGCEIRRQVGDCVMPREGLFAIVVRGGPVQAGDAVEILEQSK